jgi:hypothetical protein
MSINNRRALIRNGNIDVFPPSSEDGERFIVQVSKGRYDVIVGRKLNAEPVSHDEAQALASTKN